MSDPNRRKEKKHGDDQVYPDLTGPSYSESQHWVQTGATMGRQSTNNFDPYLARDVINTEVNQFHGLQQPHGVYEGPRFGWGDEHGAHLGVTNMPGHGHSFSLNSFPGFPTAMNRIERYQPLDGQPPLEDYGEVFEGVYFDQPSSGTQYQHPYGQMQDRGRRQSESGLSRYHARGIPTAPIESDFRFYQPHQQQAVELSSSLPSASAPGVWPPQSYSQPNQYSAPGAYGASNSFQMQPRNPSRGSQNY